MTPSERQERARLGRFETLGAWLRLWTPPKGAVVPPFPTRRFVLGLLLLAAAVAATVAWVVPLIDESKRRSADTERERLEQRREAQRRRLAAEQRAVRGAATRPAGRLTPAQRLRARRGLVRAAERAITTEARRREAAGMLTGRTIDTECESRPGTAPAGGAERSARIGRGIYDCLAITRRIPATSTNVAGVLGHPFRAVVDFRRFSFAFCKTNPPAGEGAVPDPRSSPPLPRACALP